MADQKVPEFSVKKENGCLIISIPFNEKPQPSSTGKTLVVASTHGNIPTTVQFNGQVVRIGVNAYIPAK